MEPCRRVGACRQKRLWRSMVTTSRRSTSIPLRAMISLTVKHSLLDRVAWNAVPSSSSPGPERDSWLIQPIHRLKWTYCSCDSGSSALAPVSCSARPIGSAPSLLHWSCKSRVGSRGRSIPVALVFETVSQTPPHSQYDSGRQSACARSGWKERCS